MKLHITDPERKEYERRLRRKMAAKFTKEFIKRGHSSTSAAIQGVETVDALIHELGL